MQTTIGFGLSKLAQTRNIGVIAHIDAGKTTVTERILYYTGRIHKMGEIHDGNATMDAMEEERKHGITIMAAATTCWWNGYRLNLIDTPGHADFTVEVQRSLRVLDGGVVVFDAAKGLEPQTETVWRQADQYALPRIGFVNKLDRTGADFYGSVAMVKEWLLGAKVLAIQMPLGIEQAFSGVIDLVQNCAIYFGEDASGSEVVRLAIPPQFVAEATARREELLEALADVDDDLMLHFLEDPESITPDQIKASLRQATIARKIVPMVCGSALKNKGVQWLLDAIVDYLPSPLERPAIAGLNPLTDQTEQRRADADEPLAALVFKIVAEKFGRLAFVRVYSGKLKTGSYLLNANRNQTERIGRLVRLHSQQQERVEEAAAGDIVAIIGLKNTFTGDMLCQPDRPLVLEQIKFPEPVIKLALEPKAQTDQAKLGFALQRLAEEDPTLHVGSDGESGQIEVAGMGELHLQIVVEWLQHQFGLEVYTGRPYVAYRQTVRRSSTKVTGKYIRQTGGNGQYRHVEIELEPLARGSGVEFENELVGGIIPQEYLKGVEAGVRETLASGGAGKLGYPIIDVRVRLVGGSYQAQDSSVEAFKIAASMAVREAVSQAQPVTLEPIMEVEVLTPEESLGEVLGNLSARRGQILTTEMRGWNMIMVRAYVALSAMFGYVNELRSRTKGRAGYSMQFDHYDFSPQVKL